MLALSHVQDWPLAFARASSLSFMHTATSQQLDIFICVAGEAEPPGLLSVDYTPHFQLCSSLIHVLAVPRVRRSPPQLQALWWS